MKSVVVNVKDILDKEKNPNLCLSPLRYVGECQNCTKFKQELRKYGWDIEKTIKKMSCKPQVKKEVVELYKEKQKLMQRLKEVNKKLEEEL